MARTYLMTWDPNRRRWAKMYRGRRYVVSCKVLAMPENKHESYQAANAWWERKQAEIDGRDYQPPDPLVAQITTFLGRNGPEAINDQWTNSLTAENIFLFLRHLAGGPPIHEGEKPFDLAAAVSELIQRQQDEPLPAGTLSGIIGEDNARQIEENLPKLAGPQARAERAVKAHVDRWVETQRALANAGRIAPDRADNNRICLYHFRDWVGPDADIGTIDAQRLHDYFLHCLGKVEQRARDRKKKDGWSPDYAKKVFSVARAFIRFLWESGLIDLPRNIDSRQHRFGVTAKEIRTFTLDEVRTLLAKATSQFELHLLLMLNCGMLQTDISDLKQSEVDWEVGRIRRKRSKTGDSDDVPTVDYKLWPRTFDLLKKYRSGDPETVLLTESGRRWVDKRLVAGKLVKADNVASCYAHLKRKTGIHKPLKLVRKTSTSLIETHKEYGRYKGHFLGHSPRTIADRHYAAPSKELFDEVVHWLGLQYGLVGEA